MTCAVVGAGLLGLASAYRILERSPGLRIVVLEKEPGPARHQSGHNSGVVHAGLYYVPGSLKAQLCRAGAAALREKCGEWEIPIIPRGKLVVAATDGELGRLEELERRGRENGISGLQVLDGDELREIEPDVRGARAPRARVGHRLQAGSGTLDGRAAGTRRRVSVRRVVLTEVEARSEHIQRQPTAETYEALPRRVRRLTVGSRRATRRRDARRAHRSSFRGSYWRLERRRSRPRARLGYRSTRALPSSAAHFTRGADERVTVGRTLCPHSRARR